jgi:parallel beta-helix repeat protein
MHHKVRITLPIVILLVMTWLVLPGLMLQTAASPAEPAASTVDQGAPPTPQQTTCNSCSDCSDKLASGLYVTVTLSTDLTNVGGHCISLALGESDVVFDCAGHTVDGDDQAIDPDHGIAMLHGDNNTIMNCTVSDFSTGIYLADATNHTVIDNHVTSNGVGIRLSFAHNNDVRNNTVDENVTTGIDISSSNYNAIYTNVSCNNSNWDFYLDSAIGNYGDENTCDVPDGWNDQGTTGCTYLCAGSTTCTSCMDCTSKLNGVFDRVLLANNISNYSAGDCVTFGASNVEFNCDGHTIDGTGANYGVLVSGESGNEVLNCTITDFQRGIGLASASNTTVSQNTLSNNTSSGIYLYNSTGNTLSWNDIDTSGEYGIVLHTSSNNTLSFNDLLCNDKGIRLNAADTNSITFNDVCSQPGPDFDLVGGSAGNTGNSNSCDAPNGWNDAGTTGCTYLCGYQRCSTCSDGMISGDEEGVDCGGTYCPPCAQCSGEPTTKWAPDSTPCNNKWPTSDGPDIGMNTTSDSCNLVEVCDPGLDFIIEDALTCCEHADYASRFTGPHIDRQIAACNYAQNVAYNGYFTSLNPTRLKTCLAHYLISSFGGAGIYMQNYFHGEWSCYGHRTASSCPKWCVCPPAWELGTSASCSGPGGFTVDFQMGGHRCVYYDAWIFGKYGKHGSWSSDTNWQNNSDSACDTPTHASINRLSTGTCVDYSFAVTTMLRKAGYSSEDVLSVNGDGHGYNLVRFPGEPKWHYVDTVGNRSGEVFGGPGWPDTLYAWYDYCHNLDDGCSNDVLSQRRSNCPPNSSIYGCESVLLSAPAETPAESPGPGQAASLWNYQPADRGIDQACTELNPCEMEEPAPVEPPGPGYQLQVTKALSPTEITLGESVEVRIDITNQEGQAVDVAAREILVPGVAYDLTTEEGSYESYTFFYHDWALQIPAQAMTTLTFTVVPSDVGTYQLQPTVVSAGSSNYQASSELLKVVCNPNGSCDPGETFIFCPQDCTSGIADGYCDMAYDGVNDPDCAGGVDPDFDPADDTDGDGVLDGNDACPLTPGGEVVDSAGCTCEQKICTDEDPLTADSCNPATAACEFRLDPDQDGVGSTEDNCPNDYNPEQYDTDGDSIGDQCEIGPVDADTTLDGGTYYIRDLDLEGAVAITASNVTLDCNGATLISIDDGEGYGIFVPDAFDNVTVQNCTVQGYRYGIYLDGPADNQILSNTLELNTFGIILGDSSGNTISGNNASDNTQAGIYLEGSSNNQVHDNTVDSNDNVGLFIHTSSGNDVSFNQVCDNVNADFTVYDSTNTGDENACTIPGDWNDEGTTGCSYTCALPRIYLPLVVKNW